MAQLGDIFNFVIPMVEKEQAPKLAQQLLHLPAHTMILEFVFIKSIKVLESEKLLRASCQEMKKRLDEIKSTNTHLLSDYESLAEKVIFTIYLINWM